MVHGKKILLGVTGSIAAYKAALLVRLLIKAGAEVRVVMTADATAFITPLTLATLAKHPVLTQFADPETGAWHNHVALGLWADALVIAPASANTLAKCARGACDNLLTAVYLSARCPVFFAPAMDLDMYQHPATRHNLTLLESYGNRIIDAEHGELASGLAGQGRLAEPDHIVAVLDAHFAGQQPQALAGQRVLLTAGPTQEALDPVRFLSNHSTGKMGYALAAALAERGADVTLVSGPTALPLPHPAVHRVDVRTAREMYAAAAQYFPRADVTILAAAVADYTPAEVAAHKIKKKTDRLLLELVPTTDIAAALGAQKRSNQLLVGFALETDNEMTNALDKLRRKHLDLIVLNSLRTPGAGFGHDTNQVTVLDHAGTVLELPLQSKTDVARQLVEVIIARLGH